MIYLFHGTDDLTRSEALANLKLKLGDPTTAGLNTSVLEGDKLNANELRQACDAVPFLCERRLVIVNGFWSQFEPPEERRSRAKVQISAKDRKTIEALAAYLPQVPDTTRLVFVEPRLLHDKNPVFEVLPSDDKQVYKRAFRPPQGAGLNRWIQERARSKRGAIAPQAAEELIRLVGANLRQLDQEIAKLVAHANYERAVTVSDVHRMVRTAQVPTIFNLVDAIGMRQTEQAVQMLHELLEDGAAPLYLLHMIERQFRILLQVSELQAQKATTGQIQKATGVRQPFVIQKTMRQARNYHLARLQNVYIQLADVEQQIKTGKIEPELALDLLVVQLSA